MRIGWENTRGGYYIKKLIAESAKLTENIDDIAEDVGDISDLTTTAKTDIVSAINELVSRVQALENPAPEVPTTPTEGGES